MTMCGILATLGLELHDYFDERYDELFLQVSQEENRIINDNSVLKTSESRLQRLRYHGKSCRNQSG